MKISNEIREEFAINFQMFATNCLNIRDKSGLVRSFKFNRAQRYIDERLNQQLKEKGQVRAIILKGRQQGCSTYIEGRFIWRVSHRVGARAVILTHESEATANLFAMTKRYYDLLPAYFKPTIGKDSSKELSFPNLNSGFKCLTAGNKSTGRSDTIQYFHGSEVAFWPHAEEHAKGVLQAVPQGLGTELILESTANGLGNYFNHMWQDAEAGLSDFQAIFVPWFWQDEYKRNPPEGFQIDEDEAVIMEQYKLNIAQMCWRQYKIRELSGTGSDGTKAFKQEYPMNAVEAFQSTAESPFIEPELVMRARKTKEPERVGALILACDPARFGDDRTAIIRRKGRVAYGKETYSKIDTMETVGKLRRIIDSENPDAVFIDVGGLGAGVVDRLKEMGYNEVEGVNFGERANLPELYPNRRVEMWSEMKSWLQQTPICIPDCDELHSDIIGPQYKFDSLSRYILERKEDMKRRGVRSSDTADALALTFARSVGVGDNKLVERLMNPTVSYM
tara:strand:- start:276 stop:1790 length:1515 start_codon:yes stop_codon:yes gene_type:complete